MFILFEFHDSLKLISTVIINTKTWVFHSMLHRTNNPFLLLQTIQLLEENDLFEVLPIIYTTLIAILAFQHFTTFLILHRHLKIFHLILSDESLKQESKRRVVWCFQSLISYKLTPTPSPTPSRYQRELNSFCSTVSKLCLCKIMKMLFYFWIVCLNIYKDRNV